MNTLWRYIPSFLAALFCTFLPAFPCQADGFDFLSGNQSTSESESLPQQPVKQGDFLNRLFSFEKKENKLREVRQREAAQNAAMLPEDVRQALRDLGDGKATEKQRALLFANNDLVNRARLNGVIDDKTYQNAQRDFAGINQWLGERAAKDAGAEFQVQKRDASKPYDPGTDSDYITKVKSPEQIRQMQKSYNDRINRWMAKSGVAKEPRSNWHNKLDTDFMADPAEVNAKDFKEIGHLNNDAYKERASAHYEALSRMSPDELKAAGYPGGKLPPEISSTYVNKDMEGMGEKKAKRIDKALNTEEGRQKLRDDPNARAELHKIQAQQQKYIKRKQEAAERLREAENLMGTIPQERPEITKADREFTENLAKKHKQQALRAGKSETQAEQAKNNILKSLEQNRRPQEAGMSTLPGQASKRSPDTLAKTQAASALSDHLNTQASAVYARTLAEHAGTDSSMESKVRQDIAEAARKMTTSQKGDLIEQSAESYRRGMERKLSANLDPATAKKISGEKAEEFKRGLARTMRGEPEHGKAGDSGDMKKPTRVDTDTHHGGDVAIIDKSAKLRRLDDRNKPPETSQLDEGDLIDKLQSAYNTGQKFGEAGLARNKQQEMLEERRQALARGDLNAAMRHQKKAAEYGEQAQQHFGDAVLEGLNSVSVGDTGFMGETGMSANLGDLVAVPAYRVSNNLAQSKLSGWKADEYRERAEQAEQRGENKIASKYRRLASDKQRESNEHFNEGLRSIPFAGSGYEVGEAGLMQQEADKRRAQAAALLRKDTLTPKDLERAQQLNQDARELENQKYKKIRNAAAHLPVVGGAVTRIEEVAEEYGRAASGYERAEVYRDKAKAAHDQYKQLRETDPARAETFRDLAIKYKKLQADTYIQATRDRIQAWDDTPIIGSSKNLSQTLYENRKAEEHFEAAREARERGDGVLADKHLNQAYRHQQLAREEWDKLAARAPGEAATVATLLGTGYAPHIAWGVAVYTGTRKLMENTQTGQAVEEVKTDLTSRLMGKVDAFGAWLRGEASPAEQQQKQLEGIKQRWRERLQRGEVELYPGMTEDDLLEAIEHQVSAGRTPSLQAPGDLDIYLRLPQPARPDPAATQPTLTARADSPDESKPAPGADKTEKTEMEADSPASDPATATAPPEKPLTGWEEAATEPGENAGAAIELPDVLGMPLDRAIATLEAAGLVALPPKLGSSALRAEDLGKVEVAVPEKDGEIHAGDGIALYVFGELVASGKVPNVVGKPLPEAMQAIKQAGFEPVMELGVETRDAKRDGTIARQVPQAGSDAKAGGEVRIMIYTLAVDTRKVPHLTGLTLAEATGRLREVGLFFDEKRGDPAPSRREVGRVYKQYPEAGFDVMNGIGIQVWIYGEMEKNAENTAKNAGGVPFVDIPTKLANLPLGRLNEGRKETEYPLSQRHFATSTVRLARSRGNNEFLHSGYEERKITAHFSDKDYTIAVPTLWVTWLEPGDPVRPPDPLSRVGHNIGCLSDKEKGVVIQQGKYGFLLNSRASVAAVTLGLMESKHLKPWSTSEAREILPKILAQIEPYAMKCDVSGRNGVKPTGVILIPRGKDTPSGLPASGPFGTVW